MKTQNRASQTLHLKTLQAKPSAKKCRGGQHPTREAAPDIQKEAEGMLFRGMVPKWR